MRLLGENTRRQLLGGHFEAEEADNPAIHGRLGSVSFGSGPEGFGDVESDVGRKRRLTHGWPAGEHDQVGTLQAAHHAIEINEPGGEAGQSAIAFVGARRHLDGVGCRVAERHEARAIFALVSKVVKARFRRFNLRFRRRIDGRIIGHIHHVLADDDQLAANSQIIDGAPVSLRIDDRRRRRSEPPEILRDGQLANGRLRVEERLQRDRRGVLAGLDQLGHDLEKAAMQGLEKVVRLQKARNAVKGFVVDQNRAKQCLLGLDVVRGLPEGQGIQAFFQSCLGGESGKGGGASHGEN